MEFNIDENTAKELELNDEQIEKISSYGTEKIADMRKSWDDEVKENGNKYAEGILSGAAKYIEDKTGVERDKGEKLADFFNRAGESHLSERQKEIDTIKSDYEKKIANMKDTGKLQEEYDEMQRKLAELEPLAEYKEKYESLTNEYSTLKEQTAFNTIKPNFPEEANKYEVDAKWSNFVKQVKENYNIEIVDGKPVAVDKENKYKQKTLEDLIKDSEDIQTLLSKDGNEKKPGFNGKPTSTQKIDGVPFEVPENADSQTRAKAIREYLAKQNIAVHSSEYSKRFAELNKKIMEGTNS